MSSGGLADVGDGVMLTVEPTTVMLVGDGAVDDGSRISDEGTSELSVDASGTLYDSEAGGEAVVTRVVGSGVEGVVDAGGALVGSLEGGATDDGSTGVDEVGASE